MIKKPDLVIRATQFAEASGFTKSCLDEFGQLLHILAGHIRQGKIAEFGTGCGVGTAWIASASSADVYTVDNDENRVNGVRRLFDGVSNVHCHADDWSVLLDKGPFDMIYVDTAIPKRDEVDRVVSVTEVNGMVILDDFTPVEFWPEEWKGKPDPVRDAWLNHSQLASIEIRTSQKVSALIARRIH